jgi:hypothetical protein
MYGQANNVCRFIVINVIIAILYSGPEGVNEHADGGMVV